MATCNTWYGDLRIQFSDDGDWDFNFTNGQPDMTEGLDSAVLLSIFAEADWQNAIASSTSAEYHSEFPALIERASVTDETIINGVNAIKAALDWMITDEVAETIDVSGEAFSTMGIKWTIEINRGNITSKYTVNWDNGVACLQKDQSAEADWG